MARAPSAVHRNRVIYQSEALFISPDSTGYHFTGKNGFGLMTPPLHGEQEAGEAVNGILYGWTPNDGLGKWPVWNPNGESGGTAAVTGTKSTTQDSTTQAEVSTSPVALSYDTTLNTGALNGQAIPVDKYLTFQELATVLNTGRSGVSKSGRIVASFEDGNPGDPIYITAKGTGSYTQIALNDNFGAPGGLPLGLVDNGGGSWSLDYDSSRDSLQDVLDLFNNHNGGNEFDATIVITSGGSKTDLLGAIPGGTSANFSDGSSHFDPVFVPSTLEFEFDFIANNGPLVVADATFNNFFDGMVVEVTYNSPIHTGKAHAGTTETRVIDNTNGSNRTLTVATALPAALDNDTTSAIANPDTFKIFYVGGTDAASRTTTGVTFDSNLAAKTGNIVYNVADSDPAATANTKADASPTGEWFISFADGAEDVPPYGPPAVGHGSIIKQLKRIQTINYGFSINHTDVNQFGHLSRLDSIVLENPTVNLDFSYYLLDGYNERMLEFVTNGYDNCISGHLNPEYYQAGNNFFILTVPEARDAVLGDVALQDEGFDTRKGVISIGNGFITDYSFDISVGAIPTASVTIEGMNIKSDLGTTGLNLPSIDLYDGSLMSDAFEYDPENGDVSALKTNACTGLFSLPSAQSGYTGCEDISALRPGDIVIDLNEKGLMSIQSSGDYKVKENQKGSAHLQSASLSLGMTRTNLQRLGSTFAFSKSLDVPINATLSVSAIMSDIKQGNVADLICQCEELDISITMFAPECVGCTTKDKAPAMRYSLRGAKLTSESFSSSIGDNKTVDLEFAVQLGGSDDLTKGIFVSGYEGNPKISNAEIDGGRTGGADQWGMPPGFTGLKDNDGIGRYNVPHDVTTFGRRLLSDTTNAGSEVQGDYDILGYRA